MKRFFALALFASLVVVCSRAADGAPPAAMLGGGVLAPDFSSIAKGGSWRPPGAMLRATPGSKPRWQRPE